MLFGARKSSPELPAPLPGARWEHPGPSKTYVFLKENFTFPLAAPQRRQAPQSTARKSHCSCLSTPAPRGTNCFYPSTLNFSYTKFSITGVASPPPRRTPRSRGRRIQMACGHCRRPRRSFFNTVRLEMCFDAAGFANEVRRGRVWLSEHPTRQAR